MRLSLVLSLLSVASLAGTACDDGDSEDGYARYAYYYSPAASSEQCYEQHLGESVWIRYRDSANDCAESEELFVGCAVYAAAPGQRVWTGPKDIPRAHYCAYNPDNGYTYCGGGSRNPEVGGAWIGYMIQDGQLVAATHFPIVNENPDAPVDPRVVDCWPEYREFFEAQGQ